MKVSKIFILNVISLLFIIQSAMAMDASVETESTCLRAKINISGAVETPSEVTIESPNLYMRNISSPSDLDYYTKMFSNEIAMEFYMQGIPRPQEEINKRHLKYLTWWNEGTAYTSYLVFLNEQAASNFLRDQEKAFETHQTFLKSQSSEKTPFLLSLPEATLRFLKREFDKTKRLFVGHVLLEPGDDRGFQTDAEVSYVSLPPFWNNGFVTEAVENIVALAKRFYSDRLLLEGHRIDTLIATARPDNPGSCKVLEKNGFTSPTTLDKFEANRRLYILDVKE